MQRKHISIQKHYLTVAFEEQAQEADCQSFTTAPFLRDVRKGQRQRLFVFRHDVSNVFSPKLYTMNHTNIYIYIYTYSDCIGFEVLYN
jgi:hypothetical protein